MFSLFDSVQTGVVESKMTTTGSVRGVIEECEDKFHNISAFINFSHIMI